MRLLPFLLFLLCTYAVSASRTPAAAADTDTDTDAGAGAAVVSAFFEARVLYHLGGSSLSSTSASITSPHAYHHIRHSAAVDVLSFTAVWTHNNNNNKHAKVIQQKPAASAASSSSPSQWLNIAGHWKTHIDLRELTTLQCGNWFVDWCDWKMDSSDLSSSTSSFHEQLDRFHPTKIKDEPCVLPMLYSTQPITDQTEHIPVDTLSMVLFLPPLPPHHHHYDHQEQSHPDYAYPSPTTTSFWLNQCRILLRHDADEQSSLTWATAPLPPPQQQQQQDHLDDSDYFQTHPLIESIDSFQLYQAETPSQRYLRLLKHKQKAPAAPAPASTASDLPMTIEEDKQAQQSIWSTSELTPVLAKIYSTHQIADIKPLLLHTDVLQQQQQEEEEDADELKEKNMEQSEEETTGQDDINLFPSYDMKADNSNMTSFVETSSKISMGATTHFQSATEILLAAQARDRADTGAVMKLMGHLHAAARTGASATIVWELILRPLLNILKKVILKMAKILLGNLLVTFLHGMLTPIINQFSPPPPENDFTPAEPHEVEDPDDLVPPEPAEVADPPEYEGGYGAGGGGGGGDGDSFLELSTQDTDTALLMTAAVARLSHKGMLNPLVEFLVPVLHDSLTHTTTDLGLMPTYHSICIHTRDPQKEQVHESIHKATTKLLSELLIEEITQHTSKYLITMIPPTASVLSTQEITKAINRPATYSLAFSLTRALTRSPLQDEECQTCESEQKKCVACEVSKSNDHYVDYYTGVYARYFEEYYSYYYTEFYAKLFANDAIKQHAG